MDHRLIIWELTIRAIGATADNHINKYKVLQISILI
jgi:hypothetical protein